MQIIGLIFGSKLKKCTEIGMKKIDVIKKNSLISSDIEAYEIHNYTIIPSHFFETLAVSKKCIQIIKHREKKIYGTLSHPEVRNKEIIKTFFFFFYSVNY